MFISYAREDRKIIDPYLISLKGEGLHCVIDDMIPSGIDYRDFIETEIAKADKVAVFWSERSRNKLWVRAEADIAHNKKKLIPLNLDGCDPPPPFNALQTILLREYEPNQIAQMILSGNAFPERLLDIASASLIASNASGFTAEIVNGKRSHRVELRSGLGWEQVLVDNEIILSEFNLSLYKRTIALSEKHFGIPARILVTFSTFSGTLSRVELFLGDRKAIDQQVK